MLAKNTSQLYQLPISLVTKICSFALYKRFSKNVCYGGVLKLRTTCKLFAHLTPEIDWWRQVFSYLDSNTCTFYCYKVLDYFELLCSPNQPNEIYNNWHWPMYKNPYCTNTKFYMYLMDIFNMLSENLKASVKVTLLRYIAIHNYRFENKKGVLLFQQLLQNHVNIDTSTKSQLVRTLLTLDNKQFFDLYCDSLSK